MSDTRCTCQYPTEDAKPRTPYWYITVKTCPIHHGFYDPGDAPEWAAQCGEGGAQVIRDKRALETATR